MADDFETVQMLQPRPSTSNGENPQEASWERSVRRRKCKAAQHEQDDCHSLLERDTHGQCQNSSSDSSRMIKSLGNAINQLKIEELDNVYPKAFDSSDVCALPRDPALMTEDELIRSWDRIQQNANRNVFPRKRSHVEVSSQSSPRADQMFSGVTYDEVLALKKALKAERDALLKLYMELEEERCASKTAANEALGMILRLQEEKAAALMEVRQFKRVAEERDSHNQEAITLLKEALLSKEFELMKLQEHIHFCRERFLTLESGSGSDKCKYLEEDTAKDRILFLENKETSLSCTGPQHWKENEIDNDVYFGYGHIEECKEGTSQEGNGEGESRPEYPLPHNPRPSSYDDKLYRVENSDAEADESSQNSEDVSSSILSRMRRLEERFEYIQQCQTAEYEMLAEEVNIQTVHTSQKAFPNKQHSSSEVEDRKMKSPAYPRCMEHPVNDDDADPHEDFKCVYSEMLKDFDNRNCDEHLKAFSGEFFLKSKGILMGGYSCKDNEETTYVDDDAGEGVHDVYEVQYVVKGSHINDSLPQNVYHNDNLSADALADDILQEIPQSSMEEKHDGRLDKPGGQDAEKDDDLSVKMNTLRMDSIQANATDEDVDQLKVRLQSLEAERMFMKDAIHSLRKENMELKLLQEIAQQLRELKGNVGRAGQTLGQQEQPQLLKYLKGLLSFTRVQDSNPTVESRLCCPSHDNKGISSNMQDDGGLLHLLNKYSDTPRNGCVTRERKVKLSNCMNSK